MAGKIPDWYDKVGPGWFELLKELHTAIYEIYPIYTVAEIVEKYAGLKVYLEYDMTLDSSIRHKVHDLIKQAERKSYVTCELCGLQGSSKLFRGRYKTACDACIDPEDVDF